MIRVEHLSKSYDGKHFVLKDITTHIHKGEIVSIIGPSGTGKSTVLRCLNLLEKPTGGKVYLFDRDIQASKNDLALMRQKVGMVFQSFNLFEHLTVIENIILAPMELLGIDENAARKRAMELLRTVGLQEKADSLPADLSGGQKQRVAIARTLAMNPEVVLFDEPTSALDPESVKDVLTLIGKLAQEGLTMLIVTHEMRFAKAVSTRVLFLSDGVIYEEGTSDAIFNHPQKPKTKAFIESISH